MVTNDTTTISVDYLRILTAGFERSLAIEKLPPSEWTEALQQEHRCVVDRIRDRPIPGPWVTFCSPTMHLRDLFDSSRPPHQKFNRSAHGKGRQDHYEQVDRYGYQSPYQLIRERSKAHACYTCCSIADYERASNKLLIVESATEKRSRYPPDLPIIGSKE